MVNICSSNACAGYQRINMQEDYSTSVNEDSEKGH